MDELALRDVTAPVLLRFPDILDNRIEKTFSCFQKAKAEYNFKAENFIIYPIKVNQMQPVVEEIISHGQKFTLGLEAGSKAIRSLSATDIRTKATLNWRCWPRKWVNASSLLLRNSMN